ncbi:MAG: SDR family oxidoreductase [Bacteroidia bacterium]|nr:SDR family oxidoreductase [Bacteroidia bacterium]
MNKNILLIGGSYGIGLALAKALQDDHNVIVASRSKEDLDGLNVTHIPYDVLELTPDTLELPDQIHGFVYLPGSINLRPIKMLDIDTFRKDMEINYFGLVSMVKHILPKMAEGGSMVFFSTVAVGTGMPFHTSVAGAKGAIEGFARALAAEYAPKIRCNVIAPSLVDTPLSSRLLNNERKQEAMADRHPLKRVGKPEDMAQTALFLLSENSSWMTGQTLGVDGGLSVLNLS